MGRVTSYTYDPVDNLAQRTDARGQVAKYTYDALNQLMELDHLSSDGTVADSVKYSYDPIGNRLSMTDPTGTTGYSYDALNRLASVTFPGSRTVSYGYDKLGNRSEIAYPDGKSVEYTYDESHNMATVADWQGNQTTYTYDDASDLTKTQYPNGTHTDYTYDDAGRLTSTSTKGASGNNISVYSYTLDPVGNRTKTTYGSGATETYTYDVLNRLTKAAYLGGTTKTYTYDPVGNRLSLGSTNYTYDDSNPLLSAGSTSYGYDANGNQISRGSDTFTYDQENRLTRATVGGNTSTSTYNGDGLRMSHTANGNATNYTWDVASGIPSVLQDGAYTYVYGIGIISQTDSSGNTFFYHQDALGNTRSLTDSTGTKVAGWDYDAFGAVRAQSGTASTIYRYTGQQLDSDSNLYYLRARYYDPSIGRFTSRDSFSGFTGNPQSQNLYGYVLNNPINLVDSTGHCSAESNMGFLDKAANAFGDLLDMAGQAFGGNDGGYGNGSWEGGGGGSDSGSGDGGSNFCGGGGSDRVSLDANIL